MALNQMCFCVVGKGFISQGVVDMRNGYDKTASIFFCEILMHGSFYRFVCITYCFTAFLKFAFQYLCCFIYIRVSESQKQTFLFQATVR